VMGLVAISRITGELWNYLMLWAWGTTLLMVVTTLITFAPQLSTLGPLRRVAWNERAPTLLLAGTLAVVGVAFTVDAATSEPLNDVESETVARIAPPVAAALRDGETTDGTPVPGGGPEGRYLVRWHQNELATPAEGYGMLLELERQGLDVGGHEGDDAAIVPRRVRYLEDATATVNVVVGEGYIARWRDTPGAVQVATVDRRTPAQRDRYAVLRDETAADLRAAGLDELAEGLYVNVLATLLDERVPPEIQRRASELLTMGAPMAVFVAPPEAG